MMSNSFFNQMDFWFNEMNLKVNSPNLHNPSTIDHAEWSLLIIDEYVRKVKEACYGHQFASVAEEIHFFKNIKPRFIAEFLFYNHVLTIESEKPPSAIKEQKKYYQSKLKAIQLWNTDNADFYKYIKRNATYLDHKYFVRSAYDLKMSIPMHLYSMDESFSTSHDHRMAILLANNKLTPFLLEKIQTTIEINEIDLNSRNLTWTDSKVALVELIYALYSNKSINNGNIELTQLIRNAEALFNIKLNNFHTIVGEIKSRKIQTTKFLNQLETALQKKLDASFE